MTLQHRFQPDHRPQEAYSPDNMIAALYEEAGEESPVPSTEESATDSTAESSTEEPPTEGGYSLEELFAALPVAPLVSTEKRFGI